MADTDGIVTDPSRIAALYRVVKMVNASLDLDTTLSAIMEAASQLTSADLGAAIFLVEPDGQIVVRAGHGAMAGTIGWQLSPGVGIVGRAIGERLAILVDDLAAEPGRLITSWNERLGTRSYIAAPLVRQQECVGAVTIASIQPAKWTKADVDLVTSLAEPAAAAVIHARDFQEEQRLQLESRVLVQQLAEQSEQLERAYEQLAQSEKMRAMGELVDGLAHEMNTPLGVMISNFSVLEDYARSLSAVAEASRELAPLLQSGEVEEPTAASLVKAVNEGDLEYVLTDLPALLSESTQAAERLAAIVRSLREFARADQGELSAVQLATILDSALTLASNELKHRCEVVRAFEQIPDVCGHQSELTQMFLHLLLTAAQAMRDRHGRLTVAISRGAGQAEVRVTDEGVGMSEETLARVFDPFFTTRPPGQGTGMGLTVCHGIVTRHGGTIEFDSSQGFDTTKTVRLPLAATEGAERRRTSKRSPQYCS